MTVSHWRGILIYQALNGTASGHVSAFYDVIRTYGLLQSISSSTGEASILDLILYNDTSLFRDANVLPGISDHNIVTAKFVVPQLVNVGCKIKKVCMYNKANDNENVRSLESELERYMAESLFTNSDSL